LFENIDEGFIVPSIQDGQRMFLEPIIGTGLLNELLSETPTFSAPNETLVNDYILPALKYWVQKDCIRGISYRFTNSGVQTKSGESNSPIGSDELYKLEKNLGTKAEYYGNRIRLFLIENSDTYPLYCDPGDGCDIIYPTRDIFQSGIFLGGKKGKGFNWNGDIDYGDEN